jgi:glycosyltransferase involved in cell wall biosynthesis
MISAYEHSEPFRITGTDWPTRDGSAIRDYVHVWDLAAAHVAALRKFDEIVDRLPDRDVPYEVINLGTGTGTTVRELVDAFQEAVPGALEVVAAPRRPGDVIGARTSIDKARRLLGWTPEFSLADGIRDALDWTRRKDTVLGASGSPDPDETGPMVDVMMPYYGDVGMMQEAVRSVLNQSDPRWRLTVVDDGTEPGVPEWFASVIAAQGDDKVRYYRNERNLGVTGNFQKCLSLVERDFVTMIGSDDRLLPDYIATVLDLYDRHPEASLVQPGVEVIDETGAVTEPWVDKVKRRVYAPKVHGSQVLGGEELAVSLLRGNWMYFPSICWRADAITSVGFDENLRVIQDLALTLEWVRSGALLAVSDAVCFQYRRHAVSVSSEQALSGDRFAEERRFFLDEAERMDALGWRHAGRAARNHLSSRLHAVAMLPKAALRRNGSAVRSLTEYAFGPARR